MGKTAGSVPVGKTLGSAPVGKKAGCAPVEKPTLLLFAEIVGMIADALLSVPVDAAVEDTVSLTAFPDDVAVPVVSAVEVVELTWLSTVVEEIVSESIVVELVSVSLLLMVGATVLLLGSGIEALGLLEPEVGAPPAQ